MPDDHAETDEAARRAPRSFVLPLACALVALTVRAVVTTAQWRGNALVREPRLDDLYYLDWAREIASGAVLSAGPLGASEPYVLNPLLAWVLAPAAWLGAVHVGALVINALLAAGTSWLSAAAARRHAGTMAGWTAGLAVAFSAPLVHLDGHVTVAGLAAFLVAGAVFACAPPRDGERGHGPIAAGVWLGLGALARPVALLALPFVAWLHLRGTERGDSGRAGRLSGARAALVTVAVFGAFAVGSLVRNVTVSGEPVVYTAANGLNLHLGNNDAARRLGAMFTHEFRFSPREMHADARHRVGWELQRLPTRVEVSTWYRDQALDELRSNPGASLRHHLQKARWFAAPYEVPSSADLEYERGFVPLLHLGFVPTWLLVALAAGGAWAARRERDLLLGAGGLVLAHLAACTLAFPLSHYRAPVIPALAVLAGVAVAGVLGARASAMRARAGRERLAVIGVASLVALLGWLPPGPGSLPAVRATNDAIGRLNVGDGPGAVEAMSRALAIDADDPGSWLVMAEAQRLAGRPDLARTWADRAADAQPWNVAARSARARLDLDLGAPARAVSDVDALVGRLPWSAAARGERGVIRCFAGDVDGAREDLEAALAGGYSPDPRALERCGLSPRDPRR